MQKSSSWWQSLGFLALAAAVLLASPGVRITRAADDGAANYSYDPTLEPAAQAPPPAAMADGPTCAARSAAPVLPLRGMPLLMAQRNGEMDESERLNSLNGRGYNIGGSEPAAELRKLEMEVLRKQGR